ncbi:MAG: hypothetical protein JKX94_05950 [Sneathiella sp.]|nr:hypothetical protein [Sneathiella sp.]
MVIKTKDKKTRGVLKGFGNRDCTQLRKKALDGAAASSISEDALARALIGEAIEVLKKNRSAEDISNEVTFLAENIGEEDDYTFMRP